MRTTVSSKGQIVLPAEIRERDRIEAGQEFEIERIDQGEYLLRRTLGRGPAGLVYWLLSCPEKGWFQSLDRTETTNGVKGPKFR